MKKLEITKTTDFNLLLETMRNEACDIRGASLLDCALSIEKVIAFGLECVAYNHGHAAKFLDFPTVLNDEIDNTDLLVWVAQMQHTLVSRRTTKALEKRKAKGLPLGRPKGHKNKNLKLDKHMGEITKYQVMGLNRATTARLIGVHPQTLYTYLTTKGIVWTD